MLKDLAALVAVRNHILNVMNDKSVTNRDEFQPLNQLRIRLDKKFVELVTTIDVEALGMQIALGRSDEEEPAEDTSSYDKVYEQASAEVEKAMKSLSNHGVTPTPEGAVAVVEKVLDVPTEVAEEIVSKKEEILAATTADAEVSKRIAEEKERVAAKVAAEKELIRQKRARKAAEEKKS
jgi:hypothetical protein